MAYSRPILRWLSSCPFCENYTKLYFDAKHLEKGLNMDERGGRKGKMFGALFSRKCPFWPISKAALNFSNMPWPVALPDEVTPTIGFIDVAVVKILL